MDLVAARAYLLSLLGVSGAPHMTYGSFRLRNRIIVTVPPDGGHLHVFVDGHLARAVAAAHPGGFAELWWGRSSTGARVTLATADEDVLLTLLDEAWRKRASKTMIARRDAAAGDAVR